jgi:hypothetical protein
MIKARQLPLFAFYCGKCTANARRTSLLLKKKRRPLAPGFGNNQEISYQLSAARASRISPISHLALPRIASHLAFAVYSPRCALCRLCAPCKGRRRKKKNRRTNLPTFLEIF